MIIGVSEQFQINLNFTRGWISSCCSRKSIVLNLGYSHPVEMEIPEGISVEVVKNTIN